MKSWLFVGAKVVCVDGSPHDGGNYSTPLPVVGKIYTVRGVLPFIWPEKSGTGVWLEGLTRIYSKKNGCETAWDSDRFQPAKTINTDAAITAMRELMQRAVKTQRVNA